MPSYIALLRKDPGSDYGVDFPDFPGCVTAGKDLDEARELAEEALRFHIEGMVEDGIPIPAASTLEEVMALPGNEQTAAFLVTVPEKPTRSVRVNISLPEPTLRRIDAQARARGLSRSAFLAEASSKLVETE